MSAVVHIAGLVCKVGCRLRQRCAWCGAVLEDTDLHAGAASPTGHTGPPPTWECGGLVEVDGNLSTAIEHVDGADLPPNACACLDPEITV